MNYVYMLITTRNHIYTGWTTDLNRRYREHLKLKTGAKYTRAFKPKSLAAAWRIESTRSDAMKIESGIKKLSRNEKEKLIQEPQRLNEIFPEILPDEITYQILKVEELNHIETSVS